MSKEKFLLIAVVFLLVLNGGVIVFLLMGRNAQPRPPQLFELITKRLHFDEAQKQKFFDLRDKHRHIMDSLDAEFENAVGNYFQLLSIDQPDSIVKDSLENGMASIEKAKASATLQHFQRVRELCSPEQKREFESMVPELMRVLVPLKNNQPPRRH